LSLLVPLLVPAAVAAHPLGNFTINHFVGIRLMEDRVALDVVIDFAEIPTFQAAQRLDIDGDGTVGPAETEAERSAACPVLAESLSLVVGDVRRPLISTAAGLSIAPGTGGLQTMRLVCEFIAPIPNLPDGTTLAVRDDAYAERIGWREIALIAAGDGEPGGLANRLSSYPTDPLAQPPNDRFLAFTANPVLRHAEPWTAPDAQPLDLSAGDGTEATAQGDVRTSGPSIGWLVAELSSIVSTRDLTPFAIVASMFVAVVLGIVHALSPGHGKTIMAAYLVGRGGSVRHAVGLGLSVAVSHTLGVIVLALITLLAADVLAPERLYPILGVASGTLVAVIGASLLAGRLRIWRHSRRHRSTGPAESSRPRHEAAHGEGSERHDVVYYPDVSHSHGGGRPHRHLPAAAVGLSWRSMFVLGLSGGLVPSASALILLLGSIATGRTAYGLVLVLGFGAGMALVLGGLGILVVRASSLLARLPSRPGLDRVTGAIQVATAVLVVALGAALAGQAMTQLA
jgi:ABC-type nickel/cobalt efflux system permease component RcnA